MDSFQKGECPRRGEGGSVLAVEHDTYMVEYRLRGSLVLRENVQSKGGGGATLRNVPTQWQPFDFPRERPSQSGGGLYVCPARCRKFGSQGR